ncbi:hypothetical protein NL676_017880 [Syzygium grande]|nr:hypothetical protein NL676_017880 [Syzygium grande]
MPAGNTDGEELSEPLNFEGEGPEEAPVGRAGFARAAAPWTKQITARGIVAGSAVGIVYGVIVMKLNLTTGLVPNLNVSAAFLAFVFVKAWTEVLRKAGVMSTPFTREENTTIQTCAVACYSIAVGGGFGSYLLALNKKTYEQAGDAPGNTPESTKEPGIGWMTGFLFVSSFVGLLALVPLRKIMIVDYKLTYPSGTATAALINGFHTPKGDDIAKKQVRGFAKFFSISFLWAFFQWFFSGGEQCGFSQLPIFGYSAWKNSFYFDFSMSYIGAGMICSHIVNSSLLLGALLSWGIMWPLIGRREGDWFPNTPPEGSMRSLDGYKVFISIALILGDGLYNFLKVLYFTTKSVCARVNNKNRKTFPEDENQSLDDLRRNQVFARDSISVWKACAGYAFASIISVAVIPIMFPELKCNESYVQHAESFHYTTHAKLISQTCNGARGEKLIFLGWWPMEASLSALSSRNNGRDENHSYICLLSPPEAQE